MLLGLLGHRKAQILSHPPAKKVMTIAPNHKGNSNLGLLFPKMQSPVITSNKLFYNPNLK